MFISMTRMTSPWGKKNADCHLYSGKETRHILMSIISSHQEEEEEEEEEQQQQQTKT